MGLTNAFRDAFSAAVVGGTYTPFNNANSYLGVGDSSTAFAASQTNLQAATNKQRNAMDATFPTQVANVLTFKSTFAAADAVWVWNEWGVFNHPSAGTMMSRKVESLGTKANGPVWVLTATITFSV